MPPSPPLNAGAADPSTSTCRLLELPAELRVRIYKYLFADIGPGYDHRAMLQTCRLVRQEAAPVFYDSLEPNLDKAEIRRIATWLQLKESADSTVTYSTYFKSIEEAYEYKKWHKETIFMLGASGFPVDKWWTRKNF